MNAAETFSFTVANVWSLQPNSGLWLRPTDLVFDTGDAFAEPSDLMRPLTVEGLQPRDCFVFLEVMEDDTVTAIGYIVTSAATGTIVPGDLIEQQPRTWLDEPTKHMLSYLGRTPLEDFGLQALADHLRLPKS